VTGHWTVDTSLIRSAVSCQLSAVNCQLSANYRYLMMYRQLEAKRVERGRPTCIQETDKQGEKEIKRAEERYTEVHRLAYCFLSQSPNFLFGNHEHLTKVLRLFVDGFFGIFKIHCQVWIFVRIFSCLISISSKFHFDLFKYITLIKWCFLKDIRWSHICGKMYLFMPCVMCVPT
jgi:hypothetical protein